MSYTTLGPIVDCIHDDQLYLICTPDEKRLYINDGSCDPRLPTIMSTCPVLNIESGQLMIADLAPATDSVQETAIYIYVEENIKNLDMMFSRRSLVDLLVYINKCENTKFRHPTFSIINENTLNKWAAYSEDRLLFLRAITDANGKVTEEAINEYVQSQTITAIKEGTNGEDFKVLVHERICNHENTDGRS